MDTIYKHNTIEESDATLNHILDLIVEGTWDWHVKSARVDRSHGWYRMLGYDVKSLQQDVFTWEKLIHPDDFNRVINHIERYLNGDIDTYHIKYRCKKANDHYLWILDRAKIVETNPDGTPARIIGVHLNIHDHKILQEKTSQHQKIFEQGNSSLIKIIEKKSLELEQRNLVLEKKILEIQHVSNTDPLTNISNRRKFEQELIKEMSRAKRYTHSLSVTLFDIDFFKHINDSHGHSTGDKILQQISTLVSDNIRNIDLFARWGGDEFVIIFPNLSLTNTLAATEKLRDLINRHQVSPELFVTCSFGVTQYCAGDTIEDLFHRIDSSLYRAKKLGRNRVQFQEKIELPNYFFPDES
jgi:diguanylate cyclase (GGDEF)-like protein/PAS domain S-box-containing protein